MDGVTESLTTDLSRISGAFVIARNTAFTFKGKAVDVKKLGRELNVRYVLEGAVQRGGNRLRLNVQLIDAETGNHLWAERFDKPVADLFDMQDEIVSSLANTLEAQLIAVEARRAKRSIHPDAMDLYFQGWELRNKGSSPEHIAQARGYFERALALDPCSIDALVGIAAVDFAASQTRSVTTGLHVSRQPKRRRPKRCRWHRTMPGLTISWASSTPSNRVARGIAECERALALDRNLVSAHAAIGMAKYVIGRGTETEAHVREALRLSPHDPRAYMWISYAGTAKLWQGADAEAVAWYRRSVEANRNYPLSHFYLAVALAYIGELDEARAAVQAGLAVHPSFTINRYRASAHCDHPAYLAGRERTYEGMRLAGVPEG